MRTKLLRCRDDVTVQLVYSSTLEEYRQVLDALGGAAPAVANGESDFVAAGSPHPLLGVLDSSKRTAFVDAYLAVPLDLSGVLWIATATDVGAIPAKVRDCLHIVDLPAYTEQEKLAIAQEHLLARPFDDPLPTSAGILALELAASAASAGVVSSLSSPVAPVACPTVVADRVVSSVEELRALSTGPPAGEGGAGEPWRTAASRGDISFEPEAIRRVIRDYTSEPGVKDLKGCLAEICRQVALRRSPETEGPDMVTSGLVPALLGVGSVDPLPLAVREAIEAERVRNSSDTSSNASRPSPWIEWLENLPWTKRNDAAIDLKRIRRVLDARQAGLKDAKAGVIEYLAARKRNPRGTGAVLCFLGPPGVGKTSLAQSIAQAMGRRYVRLPCGGLHDGTDLRGHNRTWYRSQPGSILRELRRVGYRDPVVVFDEVDKIGPGPAAVLLEVLDPEQQGRFRDSFVGIRGEAGSARSRTSRTRAAPHPHKRDSPRPESRAMILIRDDPLRPERPRWRAVALSLQTWWKRLREAIRQTGR